MNPGLEAAKRTHQANAEARGRARAEDYLFMVAMGEHPDRIAHRLGLQPNSLEPWLTRARRKGWLPRPDHQKEAS